VQKILETDDTLHRAARLMAAGLQISEDEAYAKLIAAAQAAK
jgi:AmiR/NasT family two-component response regulator